MPINSESLAKAREDGFSEEQIFDYISNEYDLGELTPSQALSDGYSYSQVNDYLATKSLQKLAAQPGKSPYKRCWYYPVGRTTRACSGRRFFYQQDWP
jgi:hypothetical protein